MNDWVILRDSCGLPLADRFGSLLINDKNEGRTILPDPAKGSFTGKQILYVYYYCKGSQNVCQLSF